MWQFIAAAVAQVGGGLVKGYQEARAAKYQQAEAERNRESMLREAEVEDQLGEIYFIEAENERQKGIADKSKYDIQAYLYGEESKVLMGKDVGKRARGGVRIDIGSAVESYADLASKRAYEQSVLSWQGDVAGWEGDVKGWEKTMEGKIHLDRAKVLRADAEMYSTQADLYKDSIKWNWAGSLLGGGSSGLSSLNQSGMFDTKYTK